MADDDDQRDDIETTRPWSTGFASVTWTSAKPQTALSRFWWRPDCQEAHDVHEPEPDPDSLGSDEPTCAICGHGVDVVYVHLFELTGDD